MYGSPLERTHGRRFGRNESEQAPTLLSLSLFLRRWNEKSPSPSLFLSLSIQRERDGRNAADVAPANEGGGAAGVAAPEVVGGGGGLEAEIGSL